MRLGVVIEETWDFFQEIFLDYSNNYQTSLFKRREVGAPFFYERLNRYLLHHDLTSFMKNQDVVFFEWASELLMTATHLPKTCPIVTRLHRYEMYKWVNLINWTMVDKIILVSQTKQQEFLNRFPDQAKKTVVIPVSISLDNFNLFDRDFAGDIGILCHLTPRKRVYDLILTFFELIKHRDNFHLHIAGDDHVAHEDYSESLRYLVRDLGINSKVTFYGLVEEPWNWYSKIDIFISNSYSEGLQVAPMEAMACGCYPLVHRWRGAEELVPDENLFFTHQDLISKIMHYSELPDEEKKKIRHKTREFACEKFDIEQAKSRLRTIIEEVGNGATR
jgi:glycosyltransferase involved in cell wall biosynthesis